MASEIPYWGDDPLAWDQLKINGKLVPGKVRITVKRAKRLEVRKSPKMHNATLVDQGKPLAEGDIVITIGFESAPGSPFGTARSQWAAWCALETELFGSKPGTRNAVIVSNPKFQWAKISRVYLEDPTGLDEEGPGAKTIKIEWSQYGPKAPAEAGAVKAGPALKAGNTDIRTLANVKKPSSNNTGP